MKMKFILFLLLIVTVFAYSQEVKYVNANKLNIRNGAGKDFEIVDKITKNEKVTIISENESWTEIETENGTKGFVSTKFLSNSEIKNEVNQIDEYPISSIIVGIILLIIFFRVKKFLNNLFSSSSKSRTSGKSKTKTQQIKKPIVQKEIKRQSKNSQKEEVKKDIFLCKNCGAQYGSIAMLTINNCKNINGKHQLYEGTIKSQYSCKCCGSKYNSISQMTINNCKKSSTGKHQPAL